MKSHRHLLAGAAIAIVLIALVPATARSQSPKVRTPVPRETPQGSTITPQPFVDMSSRVYPGDTAPDFELDGSQGRPVKLSGLRGDWVALVFSDRIEPISSLKPIDADMRLLGARLVAVCREKASRVNAVAQRDQLPFLVLADVTGQVGALYGLRDYATSETRPAFLLLDRRSVVKLSVLGQALPPELILAFSRNAIQGI